MFKLPFYGEMIFLEDFFWTLYTPPSALACVMIGKEVYLGARPTARVTAN